MSTGAARTRSLAALTALALAGAGTVALSTSASAAAGGALVHALTTDDRVVSFRTQSVTPDNGQEIQGLALPEDVVGIDVRPRTGELYGVVNGPVQDRIVVIDPGTGATTQVDTLDVPLSGTSFGVDWNPQADALRIVSNDGQNLRHPFANGPGTTVADTPLSYGSGSAPQVSAAAYTDNVAGTTSTQLFDIDSARDQLVLQSPPNAGTLVARGPLGVDALGQDGFDIEAGTGTAYASLQTTTGVALYTVDLASGAATRVAGLPNRFEDLTLATPRLAVTPTTVVEGATAQVVVRRTGDTADALTVDYATSGGSATEGTDYSRTTGTLSFGPGDTSETISVPTSLVGGLEGAESFTITLSRPTGGAVLSPATGTVTLTDAEDGQAFVLLTNNAVRRVPVNDPSSAGTTLPFVLPAEDLVGIDVRPADGQLYAVAASGRIFRVNTQTGATTQVSQLTAALSGTSFGVDFNPAVDRLRIVSNNGQNLRVNVDTGDTTVDGALAYAPGDRNAGVTPAVAAAGYTNNVASGTPTVLLDIDTATDSLVRQAPPNQGVLGTVGPLGVTLAATATVGLDISGLGGNGFAVLQPEGVAAPSLYRVDTETGAVRLLGAFAAGPGGSTVEDLTLVPATQATASPAPTSGSPSPTATSTPSATATTTASPTPTETAPPGQLSVTVDPSVIVPTVASRVTVRGRPGSTIELRAYSRPSTEYRQVRRGIIPSSGEIVFEVTPGTNTRLFAQVIGFPSTASSSVVIHVRTALSLTVVRNGVRDYTFKGRILPRRAGQLITLYRLDGDRRVITEQIKTDSTGTYTINRKFTGSGRFPFLTRTGQTLTNAAGESGTKPEDVESGRGTPRPTVIH